MIVSKINKCIIYLVVFFINALVVSAQTTFTCSNTTTVCACATGAKGEYYAGYFADVQTYFTTNTVGLTRTDNTINFNTDNGWGAIVPPAAGTLANPDSYSTRWTGSIYIATAGTYTFYLTSDDASWLWMGGNALATNPTTVTAFINNGGLHSPATVSAVGIFPICRMPFKIHYGENTGNNRAILEYESVALGIARQVVPQSVYCSCAVSILPIELTYYFAKTDNENIIIQWGTISEVNNKLFTVFKSTDGINWSELGQVNGSGTTSLNKNYSIIDDKPFNGLNYYYLLQTNTDGSTKKYETIFVDHPTTESAITIFPNPFQDKFLINSPNQLIDPEVEIYDALGKEIKLPLTKIDNFKIEINATSLPKGSYIIKVIELQTVTVKKLIKN